MWCFIFHMISASDLHPSPAPHFKIIHVFMIYFPIRPSFSTIYSCTSNVALYLFLPLKKVRFAGEKILLLVECCFCHGNPRFNFACTSCVIHPAVQLIEIFPILLLFLSVVGMIALRSIPIICMFSILFNKGLFAAYYYYYYYIKMVRMSLSPSYQESLLFINTFKSFKDRVQRMDLPTGGISKKN